MSRHSDIYVFIAMGWDCLGFVFEYGLMDGSKVCGFDDTPVSLGIVEIAGL